MEFLDIASSNRVGLSMYISDPAIADAWLARQCQEIREARSALLVLRVDADSTHRVVGRWPGASIDELPLASLAEQALTSRAARTNTVHGADVHLALPIPADGSFLGAVAVELVGCDDGGTHALALLTLGSGWLLSAAAHDRIARASEELCSYRDAGAALACINRWENPSTAAMELCNHLAKRFGCERVAVGIGHTEGSKLLAMSHSAWFDRRSQLVRSIENAMDEALDQRHGVTLPPLPYRKAGLALAHREFAAGRALASIVLVGTAEPGAGVIVLEREATHPFDAAEVAALERIGSIVGPVLRQKHDAFRWTGVRCHLLARRFRARLGDTRRPALRIALAAGFASIAALAMLDAPWRITADAVIEGERHRALAAPFDGYIRTAHVKAGETVRKDQPLAELDQRTLELEYQRRATEHLQQERKFHDALARRDRPAAGVSHAARQEAAAQLALTEDKLSRAILRAPFDAVIVSGDLSRQIGSPIEQGKVLFELAPLDAYRVFLKVDERDIRALKVGQTGRLILAGLVGDSMPFTVKNISIAEAHDGRNVFRVEAELHQATTLLRPGMNGVGKIDVGEARLLWVWTHKAWDWLALTVWRWLP